MPQPPDSAALQRLRRELRQLWREAHPGPWEAVRVGASSEVRLYAVSPDGGHRLLANPNFLEDARLAAAAVNALPILFAALDRAPASLAILGDVRDGRVEWRLAPTQRASRSQLSGDLEEPVS